MPVKILKRTFHLSLCFGFLSIFSVSCFQKNKLPSNYETRINEKEENEKYDGPEMIARMEFERTKNPATGKVPRELLLPAMQKTEQSKQNALNRTDAVNALTWVERGPSSDVPGPSNGNTRANGGIASGRVRAIMVDSNDATKKTVFIGSVAGGLWKTTDITVSPANWVLVNDLLSNLSIADICQDPRPGFRNIMYFCTGESYYNIDAVQGNGVFKSIDGGATWNFLPSTSSYVNGTRIRCDFQGNIYLATRGTGLLRSTAASGGGAWTNITPTGLVGDICDMEISSTSAAGRLHVVSGIFSTQAYRYTDIPATVAAGTWTAPVTAFASFAMRAEIAVSGNTLYALPANLSYQVPTIYKSIDGGANWAATVGQPTSGWGAGQAWYNLSVAIDPSNANNCIVGALDSWKTTDGGASWTKISAWVGAGQYVHADIHNITWYDGGNKLIYGCDGGIHYSSDKGTTIRDRNIGLRIKQFYSCAVHPSTTNYFLAGAQDNGVHQFNNAGLSNTIEVTGGDGAFVAIDQDQPQYQFGSYVYNDYRRSTDGGANWSSVTLNGATGQFINPFDYDNAANIMYCGDAAGAFRRWTNPQTGSTSAVVSITGLGGGNVLAVSVSPYTANRIYLGTDNGRVVQVDGANTIATGSAGTNISTGLPAGSLSCINQGTSDQNLVAVYSNYSINNVWISTNGGTSWTASDGNLPNMPVRWAMFYPGSNSKAIIATETGVWETDLLNGASTVWTANNTFPNVRTDMLEYRPIDGTVAAATHGRGLWTTVIPTVTTPDIQFQSATASSTEATAFTSGCRGYTDYTVNMQILNPPTGAATVTIGVASGTATQNIDYIITTNGNFAAPSQVLTFANGVTTPQPVSLRIYDDAAVETAETFTLNYTISGATNAQAGVNNQTLTYTIADNDAAPIPASSLSAGVGTNNISLTQPFRGSFFDARTQVLYTAAELNALGFSSGTITSLGFNVVTKASTQPYNGFTIRLKNTLSSALASGAFETGGTTVYSSNYSTVAGLNTIPITPFLWDGTSNLLIDMCFDNATGTADDLIQGSTSTANTFFDRQNTNVTAGCSIASSVFVFTTASRPIITFSINTSGTSISTALNSTKNVYLGPNNDVYFYDAAGAVLGRIKNLTAFDYGCTQVTIDRAGSGATNFWNTAPANALFSKSCKVVPTNNTTTGNYEITLYYTAAEVAGWETATGRTWSGSAMQIAKVSNGFFVPDVTPAVPRVADVLTVTGTKGTLGSNFTIMGSYTSTGFSGFGVGVPGNPILTANFRTKANGNFTDGTIWQFNNEGAGYADALQAPASSSNVNIQGTHTVTLNSAFAINTGKTITVNGTLQTGNNNITGAGNFVLSPAATLGIGSAAGISSSGATGNIQTTVRTFPTTANYTYNGSVNQITGNGLPATINNLGVANTGAAANNIVSLGSGLTVNGTTALTGGIFSIGANTLVLNGAASYGSGVFRGSTTSNLTLGGNVGSIIFDQSSLPNRSLNILNVNAGGTGTLSCPILNVKTVSLNPSGNFTIGSGNNLLTN